MSLDHVPSDRLESVRRAVQWGPGERDDLVRLLEPFHEDTYLRTMVSLSDRQVPMTPGRVDELRSAWDLQARDYAQGRARFAADSIVRTHNRLIDAAVTRLLAKDPEIATDALAAALQAEEERIGAYKWEQVQETERAEVYQEALEDFYQANSDLAGLFDFGGSEICPVCQDIADGNPYTRDAMGEIGIPHVGCLDVWTEAA